jgi:hypothetical protein
MAAVTHRNSNPVTTNAPATYVSGAFTPAVNDLLVVMIAIAGSTASPTVTDNQGGTYTLVNSALKSASADIMRMYVRTALVSSAVSHTVTATGTFTGSTGCNFAVASISGMTRTGASAIKQSAIRENRGAEAIAVTFGTAVLTGNPVIAFFGNSTNPAGVTPPSTFTELLDTGHATPVKGLEYARVDSGFTGTVVTWGSASATACGAICAEFDTSAAPTNVTGSGSPTVTLSVTASGTGVETFTGSGSPSVTLGVTASGAGEVRITGSGSPSVTLGATGSGVGVHAEPVSGSGSPTVTLAATGSGVAVHTENVSGSGSPTVAIVASGSGAAELRITGSGSPTVTLVPTGSGAAELRITGAGSPTVTLTSTGSGTAVHTETPTPITGSGSPTVTLSATASGTAIHGSARRGVGGFRRILYDPSGAQEEIEEEAEAQPDAVPEAAVLPELPALPAPRPVDLTVELKLPKVRKVERVVVDDDEEIDFILNVVLDLD